MYVIKKDGSFAEFELDKIKNAICKAMDTSESNVNEKLAEKIAYEIRKKYRREQKEDIDISEIEKDVYEKLIKHGKSNVARSYEGYRAVREYQRMHNTIDNKILGVVNRNDENIKDNSNKNTALISTMRDLVAEEVSKDYALRNMLPPHIAQAHNEGIIYIHDLGHYLNPSTNCCLINLDDMLQNSTVINNKLITKPHRLKTAATVATQIIAQVASGQFGGQTISIAHLSPFVRDSENKIREEVIEEFKSIGIEATTEQIEVVVAKRLKEEITSSMQTFQYQINTLQTSNGQAPFLSIFMYINEKPEYERETVMLIEEILRQRRKGMQNEVGAWIAPAFPKLLYVTDKNNIYPGSKYYYLTKLAAECIAHRMMPDCISAKIMKQNYEGNVFGPMGKRKLSSYKISLTMLNRCA